MLVLGCVGPGVSITNSINHISNSHNNYNLYEEHRFPEGYHEKSFSNEPCETTAIQNSVKDESANPATLSKGPMDSPWPMYCHDTKHTGRSPYNTADNPMTEIWQFSLEGYPDHCAPVLDSSGTIYVGRNHFYAIYPNGTLKWEFENRKPIEGCPVIDEQRGVLYYGIEWDSPNYLYALYLTDGSTKWKYPANGDVSSSPVIDIAGNIYFGDWNGDVHAVYPNGTRKWMYHTGDVITSSPAISDDGIIYIGSHDYYMYAFYPNGTVKWRFQTGGWVHGSPTIGSDGTVYIGSDDDYLYALNPENGAEIWRCAIGSGNWGSPTLDKEGILYLGTFTMRFHAIYPNGTIKWTYAAPGRIWFGSSAALSNDGILYFGTTWMDGGEGALIALNSKDGTEQFIDHFGRYETSPAIASDGTIYAVTSDTNGDYGILHGFGPGEPKKIVIEQPEPGKRYLFGINLGKTLLGNTIIIGSVNVKVHAYSWNEIESVHFYVDGIDQYNLTEPPFEWRMNQRYGNLFPLKHTITVTGYYKGGCSWSESIDVVYFHFL